MDVQCREWPCTARDIPQQPETWSMCRDFVVTDSAAVASCVPMAVESNPAGEDG
jgi:hypothetical protein